MSLLKKTGVALSGGVLLFAGLCMVVLPGPALLVIPAALSILAFEFLWARRMLSWLRERFTTYAEPTTTNGCKYKS